ncbi:hypothetical protein HSTV1_27 [Haloarcula sinaiiensis tailed virus 1]|uniref:Peptidase S74 domain-containing protein n=1 Tax=Haloarcula sinaiiensis tailed virus 1 TaxID=1262530 RepID=R9QSP5_9CAUD|nr:hypothetical protein HSTV1_27 [Haloarcula sinaiiensis tailed virus 1]AGC34572.1 hypothetical protein HSTV1_27 [Haloarcula sinaiiensis tailed virus 1]
MATQIQVNRSGTFEDIDYSDFSIELGTSKAQIAPTASVTSQARESIQAGQELRIIIDGTTRFEGVTQSAGTKSRNGQRRVEVEHSGVKLMEEPVTLSLASPSVSDVLNAAVDAADSGGSWTVDTSDLPALTLSNDYNVESRKVKRIFRDMTDRAEAVWWIEPTGETIHVANGGDGGLWQSFDTQTDRIRVDEFDEGDVKTVRNDVEVIGTGDVAVSATETNSTSISTYGRRAGESPYKVNYVTTEAEAGALAQALLQPDPLAQGKITVSAASGAVESPQVNKTVDLTDPSKDIDETDLTINKQVIRQSRAELHIGQGATDAIARLNRNSKSEGDVTEPGSVYDTDRIDDLAITTEKLVDTSVIEGKIADLSISETKVQDESISTPKLQAEAVVAAKIEAGTITAVEIAAGTITANEIDTLDLDTQQFTVGADTSFLSFTTEQGATGEALVMEPDGTDGFAFFGNPFGSADVSVYSDAGNEMDAIRPFNGDNTGNVGNSSEAYADVYAHNFVTASPDPIESVDTESVTDVDWYDNPPEEIRRRARDIGDTDSEVPEGRDHTPVELGTMANWLLETCKAQQERISDLEERLSEIEEKV